MSDTPKPLQAEQFTEVAPDHFVDPQGQPYSAHQIRQVVTPHAFGVATELIGTPLAKPARRGFAILLDSILIALLTSGSLLIIVPVLLYLAWGRWQQQRWGQLTAVLTITLALMMNYNWVPHLPTDQEIKQFGDATAVAANALRLSQNDCDAVCARTQFNAIERQIVASDMSVSEAEDVLTDLLQISVLDTAEQQQLLQQMVQSISAAKRPAPLVSKAREDAPPATPNLWRKLQQTDYSIVKWLQGILADLGIGFGWAVAYFTFFISWNNGQTLGKKLLGIRVVQLNNQPLSLWLAFGRQGGYSAGIATGLLGFLQIFWDPNRQAIQDKLADTLVIRL